MFFFFIFTASINGLHHIKMGLLAYIQSDQGLHCLLTESLDTTEYMNGEQRPGWYFAHGQDNLTLRILHV